MTPGQHGALGEYNCQTKRSEGRLTVMANENVFLEIVLKVLCTGLVALVATIIIHCGITTVCVARSIGFYQLV